MKLPKAINLVEVSPRDGLQAIGTFIPTKIKLDFINDLKNAGVNTIEATSFVSPKAVPQMQDHQAIISSLVLDQQIRYPVLIPNLQGLGTALNCQVKDIAVFTAASDTFCEKNIGMSIADSLTEIEHILEIAKLNKIRVRAYISCITHCPYEGHIRPAAVETLAHQLRQLGTDSIALGETLGKATPNQVLKVIDTVAKHAPMYSIALHCHNTYGQALTNIFAALQAGITTIDASASGLGGCPFAPGATGNVATEDVVYLCEGLGIRTGINLKKLIAASQPILDYLGLNNRSYVAQAMSSVE
ncbi:MAG: hydroxymethylglutaryl-CoA lyase [Coxiellaceae bacterium]|nr:hydroxymethylglutaryl-CoA lyase [Coxiellaceae bacterium]|tara:strand:- start:238 stop:1140 length:903 start_codon:yes stop_codon:yes gene_type:complete